MPGQQACRFENVRPEEPATSCSLRPNLRKKSQKPIVQYFELLVCGVVLHPSVMFSAGMRLAVRQSEFLPHTDPHRSQYPIDVETRAPLP